MTRYRVTHRTLYRYAESVTLCHNEAHLRPRNGPFQNCLSHQVNVIPVPAAVVERKDFFGNPVYYFSVEKPHDSLDVMAISEVEVFWPTLIELSDHLSWEQASHMIKTTHDPELIEARSFILESPFVSIEPDVAAYTAESFPPGRGVLDAMRDFIRRIYTDFKFDPASTTVATPLLQILDQRRGVCQDFAHLAIAGLRTMGLAARYVSGYIETVPPEGKERLIGADASHAWLAAFIPGFGWIDLDPTNNHFPVTSHVTLSWGRDYGDVAPLKGVITGGGGHALVVAVDVVRLADRPDSPSTAIF